MTSTADDISRAMLTRVHFHSGTRDFPSFYEGRILFRNFEAVGGAYIAFKQRIPWNTEDTGPLPSDFPPIEIEFPTEDGEVPDVFVTDGLLILSARLRAAMALRPGDFDSRDVHIVEGAPRFHVAGFKAVHLRRRAAAIDGERTGCGVITSESELRGITTRLDVEGLRTHTPVIRDRFVPPAEVFTDLGARFATLATEALARRVLAAGCDHVTFVRLETAFKSPRDWDVLTAA